jgi:hypothetical protein
MVCHFNADRVEPYLCKSLNDPTLNFTPMPIEGLDRSRRSRIGSFVEIGQDSIENETSDALAGLVRHRKFNTFSIDFAGLTK